MIKRRNSLVMPIQPTLFYPIDKKSIRSKCRGMCNYGRLENRQPPNRGLVGFRSLFHLATGGLD